MNAEWVYVGASTLGPEVAWAVARPRWSLYRGGRKPRGEWRASLVSIRRAARESFVEWLGAEARASQGAIGASPRSTVILDVAEVGGGDLLRRSVDRALERAPILKRARFLALEVTPRDIEPSGRTVARRDVLAPFLDAIERDALPLPKGPYTKELIDQYDALTRKPDALGGREDLVRAVALCVWAIDLEGQEVAGGEKRGGLYVY